MAEFDLLKGRTAIVTGGASGLGFAMATAFLSSGASVVIADINVQALASAERQLGSPGRVLTQQCDVTSSESVTSLVNAARESFGSLDVMVNNAGFTRDGTMRRLSEQDFDDVISVHLRGCWLGTRAASSVMREHGGGSIINMSSISGKVGNAGQTNYSAAKAGIVGLTKAAAKEVGFAGVRVNAIRPGLIDTAMTSGLSDDIKRDRLKDIPLGRFGTVAEVASVALFLASDMSSYLTGTVIDVSGGRHT